MSRLILASVGATLLFGAQHAAAQEIIPTAPPIAGPSTIGPAPAALSGSLIIDQQRTDRAPVLPATPKPAIEAPSATVSAQAQAPAAAATLRSVRVDGATIPAEPLRAAWAPFVGQPVTQATLQALANAITAVYAKSDRAIYSVNIAPQTLANGEVVVTVTEGLIGQVALKGDVKTRHLRLLKKYSAKLASERPLRRETLERYLSLIRDIPGLTVTPSLTPTKLPGVSVLTLDIKRKQTKGVLTFDDRGSKRLGRVQIQGSYTINSLFQQGDQTVITAAAPVEYDPFQYISISHSMPIGADGLTLNGNLGYLRTRPKDSPVTGDVTTAGLNLTYPIKRGFTENLYVTAALDGQNSDNAAYGQAISSDHTRTARVALSWSKQAPRAVSSASLSASQGINGLDAEVDDRLTDPSYRKLNIQLGRNQAIGQDFAARVKASAQLSQKRLPSSEQFSLGGEQYGRAFPAAYLLGDSGGAVSGEIAWMSKTLWPSPLKGSELYGFADYGKAKGRSRFNGLIPASSNDLSSAGIGARFNWRNKTIINVEGATAVENPYPGNDAWRLLFGWRSLF